MKTAAAALAVGLAVGLGFGCLLWRGGPEEGASPTLAPKEEAPPAPPPPHRIDWPLLAVGADPKEASERGLDLFVDNGCWQCHALGGMELPGVPQANTAGPDLAAVGARLSPEELIESIVNPNATISEPRAQHMSGPDSKMGSYRKLYVDQLLDLTYFLSLQQGEGTPPAQ